MPNRLLFPSWGWRGRTSHGWGSPGHYCEDRNPRPMAHAHYFCEQLLGTGEEEADLLPASSILACLFFWLMDLVSPSDRLCYVRCTYCNTVLAVRV
ncbi:hypothetical protein BHM03_00019178 [Ensete ventricosum]|nr:hypothetical protein BHM03_00019178 [Ensete ventricosum]